MKKFLAGAAAFLLTLVIPFAGFIAYVQQLPLQFSNSLMGSLNEKYELLCQEGEEPRIIIVGGSSSVYGSDCELITEISGMDCICVGVVQGLGIEFYSNLLYGNLREGDIVFFAPEYNMWAGIYSPRLVWSSCENETELYTRVPLSYWPKMFSGAFWGYAKDKIALTKSNPEGFPDVCPMVGPKGDVAFDRPETLLEHGWLRDDPIAIDPSRLEESSVRSLNRLNDHCLASGATLLIGYAPITEPAVSSDKEDVDAFVQLLQESLEAEIVGDIWDCIMDKSLFYDSNYHLTNEGTEIRSQYIAGIISEYIDA